MSQHTRSTIPKIAQRILDEEKRRNARLNQQGVIGACRRAANRAKRFLFRDREESYVINRELRERYGMNSGSWFSEWGSTLWMGGMLLAFGGVMFASRESHARKNAFVESMETRRKQFYGLPFEPELDPAMGNTPRSAATREFVPGSRAFDSAIGLVRSTDGNLCGPSRAELGRRLAQLPDPSQEMVEKAKRIKDEMQMRLA